MAFQYEPDQAVRPLLETFRMMVNHALWVGVHRGIRGRFHLIKAVYEESRRYGLHTHYTLNACEVASAILKNHRGNHRAPLARKLFLKLDNQTYQLRDGTLSIPIKPRQFLTLRLRIGDYQRQFLNDSTLRLGSITLTESKLTVAFNHQQHTNETYDSVVAYDTNELSLDGALANGAQIKSIHVNLRQVARVRAFHLERRRYLQKRLSHCQRKLTTKLSHDRDRERRRVDAVLHLMTKQQIDLAKQNNAKIILEDLKGLRRSVNRRVRSLNQHNGKLQPIAVHSKLLKRRLNTWPFRRLHGFIEYKAKWAGVPLSYVSAKNTSRTCSRCGCLQIGRNGEQDRKAWQVFRCPKCGWRCGRHLNAALNLLKRRMKGNGSPKIASPMR